MRELPSAKRALIDVRVLTPRGVQTMRRPSRTTL
jgi:hypothetical protein